MIQPTPGQKCILDLLQKNLSATIRVFRELSLRRNELNRRKALKDSDKLDPNISKQINLNDHEIDRLHAKIIRISARQKRFTNEILSGNGNSTIPKENYFRALGLITKEALDKINLKSGERRRRTTANPRFSHEAIQAKRALEHHSQTSSQQSNRSSNRLEDRATRGVSTRAFAGDRLNSKARRGRDKLDNGAKSTSAKAAVSATAPDNNISTASNINVGSQQQQQPKASSRTSNGRSSNSSGSCASSNGSVGAKRSSNNPNRETNQVTAKSSKVHFNNNKRNLYDGLVIACLSEHEKQQLQEQFGQLQRQLFAQINNLNEKREKNKRREEENEILKKRGVEMVNALNEFCQDRAKFAGSNGLAGVRLSDVPLNLVKMSSGENLTPFSNTSNAAITTTLSNGRPEPVESSDIWLNLKCDESLEGMVDNLSEQ